MAVTFEIKVDQAKVDRIHFLLADVKNGAELAFMRSINNTLTGARALTAQKIGQKATLKAAKIKEHIALHKASIQKLSGRISIDGKPIKAVEYTTRELKTGVSIKYYKDESPLKLRHAFMATMQSWHRGVFTRRNYGDRIAPRLPIDEQMGPSVMTLYENTPGISEAVETEASERLLREMESQVNYILEKHKGT